MDVPRDLHRRDVLAEIKQPNVIELLSPITKVRSVDRHDQRSWRLEYEKPDLCEVDDDLNVDGHAARLISTRLAGRDCARDNRCRYP